MSRITPQTQRIYHLFRHGLSIPEIVRQASLPRSTVAAAIQRGRANGDLPKPKRGNTHPRYLGIRYGSVGWLYEALLHDQKVWLAKELQDNDYGSIAEYALELIRDAFEEGKHDAGR